jgi:hypothetical protein
MDTMTLYRVAHKTLNVGPWNLYWDTRFCTLDKSERDAYAYLHSLLTVCNMDLDIHMNIREDLGCGKFNERMHCATTSIENLKFWFFDENIINALFDANFVIFEITVLKENVKFGKRGRQVAYDMDDVLEIRERDLLPLVA